MISSNLIKILIRSAKHNSFICHKSYSINRNISTLHSFLNPKIGGFIRKGCPWMLCNSSYTSEAAKVTNPKTVTIRFVLPDGQIKSVNAKLDSTILDVVLDNNVGIDGFGACEGTLACSTCHLVFSEEDYKKLPNKPSDEELDMLDLAYGLTDTSRLGCQIKVTKDMDGLQVTVPAGMADVRS